MKLGLREERKVASQRIKSQRRKTGNAKLEIQKKKIQREDTAFTNIWHLTSEILYSLYSQTSNI
jgi:hypothetical protein